MKKYFNILLTALLLWIALADLTPAANLTGSRRTLFTASEDLSNATATVVNGIDGRTINTFKLNFMIDAADTVTLKCGSVVRGKWEFTGAGGLDEDIYPLVIPCRPDSAALTGTVFTLDNDTTFTADATSNVITLSSATGIVAGHPLVFKSTTTLPAGLVAGTVYYYGLSTGKLYTTSADAITDDGTTNIIDITDTGTGTHSLDGTYVLGSSTSTFTTDFAAGDTITIGNTRHTVSTAASATKLTVSTALTTNSSSANSYKRGADNLTFTKGTAANDLYWQVWYEQEIDE